MPDDFPGFNTLIQSGFISRKEKVMLKIKTFIKKHPVLAYYTLVFAISWGCILIVLGPGGFLGTTQAFRVQLYIGGPLSLLGPSIAGVLLTGLVYGKTGLRDILARLLRWRVRARWYVVALLTAPLLTAGSLFVLSLTPTIVTATDKASLLVSGFAIGFLVPFFEELGWTGFAIPEIRKRHGILATGLIMGFLWGVWHFPIFSASAASSGVIPPAIYLAVLLFSWLIPYRVLMVWVYNHTKSLLVAMVMHMPLVVDALVLSPERLSGAPHVVYLLLFTAALWVLVFVVVRNGHPGIALPQA